MDLGCITNLTKSNSAQNWLIFEKTNKINSNIEECKYYSVGLSGSQRAHPAYVGMGQFPWAYPPIIF